MSQPQLCVPHLPAARINPDTSSRPLQFRVAIRDSWENAESPIQKALKELGDEIGIPISIQLQWPMLWDQLGKHFPDKSVFVPTVTDLVSAWRQVMKTKLDEEDDTAWSEEFLEAIKGQSSLVVRVEVGHRVPYLRQRSPTYRSP